MQISLIAPLIPHEVDVLSVHHDAFRFKQPPLLARSAKGKMRSQPALSVHDAVAGYHAGHWVFVKGITDSTCCAAVARKSGDLSVGRDAPARDKAHRRVDFVGKGLRFHQISMPATRY